jgi:hypothetical protein
LLFRVERSAGESIHEPSGDVPLDRASLRQREIYEAKGRVMSEFILEPRRTAVVAIDIQKGIAGIPGAPHSTASVVANCVRLVAAARES